MAGFFRRKWQHDAGKTQNSSTSTSVARQHGRSGTNSVVVSGPMSLSASRHGRRESDPSPGEEEEIDEASSVCCFGSACRQIRRLAFGSHLPCCRISATACSTRMW